MVRKFEQEGLRVERTFGDPLEDTLRDLSFLQVQQAQFRQAYDKGLSWEELENCFSEYVRDVRQKLDRIHGEASGTQEESGGGTYGPQCCRDGKSGRTGL